MFFRTLVVATMVGFYSLSLAQAQSVAEPSQTTAIYGDWITRCETAKRGDETTKSCEIAQAIAGGNGQGKIAQIVIGRAQGEKVDRVVVELPAGIWLPDGVLMKVADKDFATLTFKRCVQSCFASAPLTDAQREALFAATAASFVFKDATQKPVTLPLSGKGIREAYKAMAEK
ncbi:invasion associated locus B family protein [Rhizobium sp.]|jgi:invasion protein IalB|uniref:invasion associated locus B family protein n=1 Tax=Rhizobium sp. TaxID=391 RepID=UPI000E7D6B4B|nr:invasion-associated locus B family protein [Rhizobium sp.]